MSNSRLVLVTVGSLVILSAMAVVAQEESRMQRFERMSAEAEREGLADPFRGITIDGKLQDNLFSIGSTGVSTEPVRGAAAAFLASLTPEQKAKTLFAADDDEWRNWMNQHFYVRKGMSFQEMTDAQREAAFGLMQASLSARGMQLTRDIMRLNHTLAELNDDNFEEYGEWRYSITVMGEPSVTEPWGWQFDGHHGIINYFVLGDQVVMAPAFFGSEPIRADAGKFKGVEIMQDEQDKGLMFMQGLSPAQQQLATLSETKDFGNIQSQAYGDNIDFDSGGLPGRDMSDDQQGALMALIELYVGNMDDGHAAIKMQEVAAHIDDTTFAWIGESGDDAVFYYRILSPVLLIEFDHMGPIGMRHLLTPGVPTREHVHAVIRTPNGNDYGKDLLRQHYATQAHHQPGREFSPIRPRAASAP